MSSSTPPPTTSTATVKKEATPDVKPEASEAANGKPVDVIDQKLDSSKDESPPKLAAMSPRPSPDASPKLVIASPTPSPKPEALSPKLVAASPRPSPKPLSVSPKPLAASPPSLSLSTTSPKPSLSLPSPLIGIKEPTLGSSSSVKTPPSAENDAPSSSSPKVTAPRTLPIIMLPPASTPTSTAATSKSPVASTPTASNAEASSSLPEPSKLNVVSASSAPETPKLITLSSGTSTPSTSASTPSAPEPSKSAKSTVNGRRKSKEKKTTGAANLLPMAPGKQLKPGSAIPFPPNMMGQPIFYRPAGSNQMIQFYPNSNPAMLQQLQKLRADAPTSNGQTATAPAKPSGPVPIAPRPANMPSTSTASTNHANAKIAPKKPSAPANIRPRPIEKRPPESQPGPSGLNSMTASNPSIVSILQRAPNNIAMYYPQGVRFAAPPMQGTPVSSVATTSMGPAFRMMHPGAAGIFPGQMPPGAMMTQGGYMPYPFMSYAGPQYVQMPTIIPTASLASTTVPGAEGPAAPTLTIEGPSVAQTSNGVVDEDENDPPPPLLEPDLAEVEMPPPTRPDAIAAAEAAAAVEVEEDEQKPTAAAAQRAKAINEAFWKQATVFRRLRKTKQKNGNSPLKHVVRDNMIEEKDAPFTPPKTSADRLAELRSPKKSSKRAIQQDPTPSPEASEDETPAPESRGRGKKHSLPAKSVKVEPKKSKPSTTPKRPHNGTSRSAPSSSSTTRGSSRSVNTPTSSSRNNARRSGRGRVSEVEKLIAMDFGSGKSPFQTTNVSEYVKKVKKESTLLRPSVGAKFKYREHDDYDDDEEDEEDEEIDYDSSMITEDTPELEDDTPTPSTPPSKRSGSGDSEEEEYCLGCSASFKGGKRSVDFPQYCSKACRADYRNAKRRSRKRQSDGSAMRATPSSSVNGSVNGLDELPHRKGDEGPSAKVPRFSDGDSIASGSKPSTPSLNNGFTSPSVSETVASSSKVFNPLQSTSPPSSAEPIDPISTTPSSSVAPTATISPPNELQKALDTTGLSLANVHDWTADEVAIWVNAVTNSTTAGDSFRLEEIDGSSLLMLNSEHLKEALKFKLGPSLKLGKAIDWLRKATKTPEA